MRLIVIFISISILGCFQPSKQKNNQNVQSINQISSFDILDHIITSGFFEKEVFKVDTINFYEGYAFYIRFFNDSSYLRVNDMDGMVTFDCCTENSIYKEINRTFEKGIIDRNGKVNTTNLYWREIKDEDVETEIAYNNCPKEKLKLFNKIMDSVYKKLYGFKK
jgi:hypothetical protein